MSCLNCYHFSVRIKISFDLKVYLALVTWKINSQIAFRLTNWITEISAVWWLWHYIASSSILFFSPCLCMNFNLVVIFPSTSVTTSIPVKFYLRMPCPVVLLYVQNFQNFILHFSTVFSFFHFFSSKKCW